MESPILHEIKKQASCFFKEKIKSARLILTDVTPAQLMTEEATNGNPWPPETRTMGVLSRAAFEVDDYWRIVEILHQRLSKFDKKNWRVSYKALLLLEHLLTHGPLRISEEFLTDKHVIKETGNFEYIDERGFNWGLSIRKLSERISKLLENETFLKEERARARQLTHGIEGFGSFSKQRMSAIDGSLKDTSFRTYGRCNSYYNYQPNEGNESLRLDKKLIIGDGLSTNGKSQEKQVNNSRKSVGNRYSTEEDHPFSDSEHQAAASLLHMR